MARTIASTTRNVSRPTVIRYDRRPRCLRAKARCSSARPLMSARTRSAVLAGGGLMPSATSSAEMPLTATNTVTIASPNRNSVSRYNLLHRQQAWLRRSSGRPDQVDWRHRLAFGAARVTGAVLRLRSRIRSGCAGQAQPRTIRSSRSLDGDRYAFCHLPGGDRVRGLRWARPPVPDADPTCPLGAVGEKGSDRGWLPHPRARPTGSR